LKEVEGRIMYFCSNCHSKSWQTIKLFPKDIRFFRSGCSYLLAVRGIGFVVENMEKHWYPKLSSTYASSV